MVREDACYDFNILNLSRLVFCPIMWSILENISCALEKNVYSAALRWNALKISIKFIWPSVSLKASISLLIFLSGRSIQWWQWAVKIPYYDCFIVNLSLYVHQDLFYIFRCSYVGCLIVYKGYILLLDCSLYHYVVPFFVFYFELCFKVYILRYTVFFRL